MVNVNGVLVRVESDAPRKVTRGWLHVATVYHSAGPALGTVMRVSRTKHSETSESWVHFAADGRTLRPANISDLVSQAMVGRCGRCAREGAAGAAGLCSTCFEGTEEPAVCLGGNPTLGDRSCGDPDCVCASEEK